MLPRNAVRIDYVTIQRLTDGRCLVRGESAAWNCLTLEFFIPESICPAAAQYTPGEKGAKADHLWTYCAVNNNDGTERWYGFMTWEQREFFIELQKADGVGPGAAYKIMNSTSWSEISRLLRTNDQDGFRKMKGVGPKTADKLIPILFADKPKPAKAAGLTPEQKQAYNDAVAALTAMGVPKASASLRVTAAQGADLNASADALVRAALKNKS
jgi:Holliday junction DNA helicase RuvA